MKSTTSSQQAASTEHPELAYNFAILQPRTCLVDFLLACRNSLQGKSLLASIGLPCPAELSPFGIFALSGTPIWDFLPVFGGNPHFVLTFSSGFSGPASLCSTRVLLFSSRGITPFRVHPRYRFAVAAQLDFSLDQQDSSGRSVSPWRRSTTHYTTQYTN